MPDGTTASEYPTVVLVHGAFADASNWNGVIKRLQAQCVPVTAPANPRRGVSTDSAYIAGLLEQIPCPVVAVGHHQIALAGERHQRRRARVGTVHRPHRVHPSNVVNIGQCRGTSRLDRCP